MRFGVLGPPAVEEGGDEVDIGGPRQRALLALLVARRPEAVPAGLILEELWPEGDPEKARRSLHTLVSNIRRGIGPERLARVPGGYRLSPAAGDAVDADEFVELLERARRAEQGEAIEVYAAALGLWRGAAYEGIDDVPTVATDAARLEELRWTATEERHETELAAGSLPSIAALAAA